MPPISGAGHGGQPLPPVPADADGPTQQGPNQGRGIPNDPRDNWVGNQGQHGGAGDAQALDGDRTPPGNGGHGDDGGGPPGHGGGAGVGNPGSGPQAGLGGLLGNVGGGLGSVLGGVTNLVGNILSPVVSGLSSGFTGPTPGSTQSFNPSNLFTDQLPRFVGDAATPVAGAPPDPAGHGFNPNGSSPNAGLPNPGNPAPAGNPVSAQAGAYNPAPATASTIAPQPSTAGNGGSTGATNDGRGATAANAAAMATAANPAGVATQVAVPQTLALAGSVVGTVVDGEATAQPGALPSEGDDAAVLRAMVLAQAMQAADRKDALALALAGQGNEARSDGADPRAAQTPADPRRAAEQADRALARQVSDPQTRTALDARAADAPTRALAESRTDAEARQARDAADKAQARAMGDPARAARGDDKGPLAGLLAALTGQRAGAAGRGDESVVRQALDWVGQQVRNLGFDAGGDAEGARVVRVVAGLIVASVFVLVAVGVLWAVRTILNG